MTARVVERCRNCHGRGWYAQCTNPEELDVFSLDYREAYCDCEAGRERRVREKRGD